MTEPLDLAAIRAACEPGPFLFTPVNKQVLRALCDEIERLQLRETTLQFTLDTERGENERLRAENARLVALVRLTGGELNERFLAVERMDKKQRALRLGEAARAWRIAEQRSRDALEMMREGGLDGGVNLDWISNQAMQSRRNLDAAVAAYEAQQGEKP